MLATLTSHRLLEIEDTSLDTGKLYQHDFQGYQISGKNRLLFVFHKKEIKLIELKNIGSTMGVFYFAERPPFCEIPLLPVFVELAWKHFEGFDEETGERYYFSPAFSPQRVESTNAILRKLGISFQLQQSAKGVTSPWTGKVDVLATWDVEQLLNHFFGLVLLYGKFDGRQGECTSIKIQLPLTSGYLGLQDFFQEQLHRLQAEGFFLQSSLNVQQGKTTLQITSNDWEVLQIFADWYKPVENFSQITKKGQTVQAVQQLMDFLAQEGIDNADEVKAWIEKWTVKVLVK